MASMRSGRIAIGVIGLAGCLLALQAARPPRAFAAAIVTGPVRAVYGPAADVTSIRVYGHGFGLPGSSAWVAVKKSSYGGQWARTDSTDPRVSIWRDDLIVFTHNNSVPMAEVRVHTSAGFSSPLSFTEVYEYSSVDLPQAPGEDSYALAVTMDANRNLWVNSEFHLSVHKLTPTGWIYTLPVPQPAGLGPFSREKTVNNVTVCEQTRITLAGEDVEMDPWNRAWFTEGGGSDCGPNHSRIVRVDAYNNIRVWNVPGDHNGVWGVLYDTQRNRVWFGSNAHDDPPGTPHPAKLTSFDPNRIPYDNTFDFSTSLDDQICAPGEPDADCYHEYPLPPRNFKIAHIERDAQGYIWYTGYWGVGNPATGQNEIGRLDPATGTVLSFPLPALRSEVWWGPYVGSGPWEIRFAPNGDVIFNEFVDVSISRFDISRVNDIACRSLTPAGVNPCITELEVPDVDLETTITPETAFMHSIDYAADGNLWFTMSDGKDLTSQGSVGYVKPNFTDVVVLPPLAAFGPDFNYNGSGLVVDPTNGDVWIAEFGHRRLGKIRRTF